MLIMMVVVVILIGAGNGDKMIMVVVMVLEERCAGMRESVESVTVCVEGVRKGVDRWIKKWQY